MRVTVISWNMADAKVFDKLDGRPDPAAGTYTQHFQEVWNHSIMPYLSSRACLPTPRSRHDSLAGMYRFRGPPIEAVRTMAHRATDSPTDFHRVRLLLFPGLLKPYAPAPGEMETDAAARRKYARHL
jgi:hypothetical protein